MPLPVPNLDDRDYAGLLRDAKALVPTLAPEWTDFNAGDPGVALLELFAYLTESMLFRLNRLPEKAYVELLNLVGVKLGPPAVAKTELVCSLKQPGTQPVTIRRGTRVTTTRPNGPVFVVADDVVIAAGATEVRAVGLHCELQDDALGTGNGAAGQRFTVTHPPIVLDSGELGDLYVGVEATEAELGERVPSVRMGSTTYRLWREVTHFGGDLGDGYVFVVDRAAGAGRLRGRRDRRAARARRPTGACLVPVRRGRGRQRPCGHAHGAQGPDRRGVRDEPRTCCRRP